MIRLLLTADLHLTSNPTDEYRWNVFPQLERYARRRKPNAIFILGDLTEKKDNHSAKLVNRLITNIKSLARITAVHILQGNHDYYDPKWPFFEFLSALKGVEFHTGPVTLDFRDGQRTIGIVPHTEDFSEAVKSIDKNVDYLFFHQAVEGARAYGTKILTGENFASHKLLERFSKKTIMVAGDIHTPQVVGRMRYCGAPHPVDHGDDFKPRFLLIEDRKIKRLPIDTIKKSSLKCNSVDEALDSIAELSKGDMAIVNVRIPESAGASWAADRQRLLDLAKERGVVLSNITASSDKSKLSRNTVAVEKMSNCIEAFCEAHKITGQKKDLAKKIVKAVEESSKSKSSVVISPQSLDLQGYKGFGKNQHFEFGPPGLYQIVGENKVHPRLGANATGKSSLIGAVSWILYDKTERGLKANDIKSWTSKEKCQASLAMQINGKKRTLYKTWRPNYLSIGGEKVSQAELEQKVGQGQEPFLHSVLMGQFNPFFFDLKPADKLALFSDAMDLDRWLDAGEHAKQKRQKINEKLQHLTNEEQRLSGAVLELSSQSRKIVADLRDARRSGALNLKALQARITEVAALVIFLDNKRADGARALRELDRTLNEVKNKSLNMFHRLKDYLDKGKATVCPTCKRPLKKAIKVSEKKIHAMKKKARILEKRADKIRGQIREVENENMKLPGRLLTARRELEGLRSSESAQLSAQSNLSEINERRAALEKERQAAVERQDQLSGKIDRLSFWVDKFKDVRLWMIKSALKELEQEISNNLLALGLEGWTISFDIESVTQKGTVSRGFNVFVESPDSPKGQKIKWESWSGGETQRLRAAGAAGFAELVAARSGCRWDVEFWDEPSEHLSDRGVQDLFMWLKSRAAGKRVYVIDHRGDYSGIFDAQILVKKTKKGSRIIQT